MAIASWFLPSLLALCLWGVSVFLPKLAVRTLAPLHLSFYANVAFLMGGLIMMALLGFPFQFELRGVLMALAVGIFGGFGNLFYIYSIQHGSMTYGTIVTALYPVVTSLLAYFILDENLSAQQLAGIVLGICSLVLMVMADDNRKKK